MLELFSHPRTILVDLPGGAATWLREAREKVRNRLPHRFQPKQLTALSMCDGSLYSPEMKRHIVMNLGREFALLIFSGGYGLLRPDEAISEYDINIRETLDVWNPCLPAVLRAYAAHNGISEVEGIFSRTGAYLQLARRSQSICQPSEFRIHVLNYHGAGAQNKIPSLQGQLLLRLSKGEWPTSIDGVSITTEH